MSAHLTLTTVPLDLLHELLCLSRGFKDVAAVFVCYQQSCRMNQSMSDAPVAQLLAHRIKQFPQLVKSCSQIRVKPHLLVLVPNVFIRLCRYQNRLLLPVAEELHYQCSWRCIGFSHWSNPVRPLNS